MSKSKTEEIVYVYRGPIERGADYHWTDGYSEATPQGFVLYPWMTKRECQQAAKRQGKRARFVNEGGAIQHEHQKRRVKA